MDKIQPSSPTNPVRAVPSKFDVKKVLPILAIVVIVAAGIFTGLVLSSRSKSVTQQATTTEEELEPAAKESFNQTFRDEAEGEVQKNDEFDTYAQGTHKLIRPGGDEQTAFLTSSVLDLDEYEGKNVKVFGETFGSSQVGWLMDVGKVEVVE